MITTGHTSLADLSVRLSRQIQEQQESSPGAPIQQANENLRKLGRAIWHLRKDLGMTVQELTTRARADRLRCSGPNRGPSRNRSAARPGRLLPQLAPPTQNLAQSCSQKALAAAASSQFAARAFLLVDTPIPCYTTLVPNQIGNSY